MNTAEKIRAQREALGLTQERAAEELGMSVRALAAAENGERTKRPLRRYEVAGILSIYAQLQAEGATEKESR